MKRRSKAAARPAKKRIVEGLDRVAAVLKVPVSVVKTAKRLGAPGFQPGNRVDAVELKAWIERQTPSTPHPRGAVARPIAPDDLGAAANLRRLEAAEVEAHAAFVEARRGGNPLAIELAGDLWLRVSEQRRRADLATDEARKGDSVSVPSVVGAMQLALESLRTHCAALEKRLGFVLGKQARDQAAAEEILVLLRQESRALGVSVNHVETRFVRDLRAASGDFGRRFVDHALRAGEALQRAVGEAFHRLAKDADRGGVTGTAVREAEAALQRDFAEGLAAMRGLKEEVEK